MDYPEDPIAQAVTFGWTRYTPPDRFFWRGVNYFLDGRVVCYRVTTTAIAALVRGNYTYSTCIFLDKVHIRHSCTCPVNNDMLCKHLVATALTYLDGIYSDLGDHDQVWLKHDPDYIAKCLDDMSEDSLRNFLKRQVQFRPELRVDLVSQVRPGIEYRHRPCRDDIYF